MILTTPSSCSESAAAGIAGQEGADPLAAEPVASDEPDPAGSYGLVVTLDLQAPDSNPSMEGWLPGEFARIAALAGVDQGQVNLAIVGDTRMTELHRQYCDEPGTTDVLTFDLRDDPNQPIEGDIVLCIDEAHRQATQRNHDTRLELLLYAVHGLLHLLGENDHEPADYERMHRRENELLTRAGLGPVFGDVGET